MLYGIDVSMHQNEMDFSNYDFVIMKASEGNGYKDPKLDLHYNNLHGNSDGKPDKNKLYGFYHYARPDLGNTPQAEAEWFVSLVGHHSGNCLFILDWEQESLAFSPSWAKQWMDRVFDLTGVKPLIYIQASQEWTTKYNEIRDADYGLWIAHWGVQAPVVSNWEFWAIWQYQGSPLDSNYFNGDAVTFKKYCGSTELPQPSKPSAPSLGIIKGAKVKVLNLVDYNGVPNDLWVLDATFVVMENPVNGRVVIGNGVSITGAWHYEDLKAV